MTSSQSDDSWVSFQENKVLNKLKDIKKVERFLIKRGENPWEVSR